MVRNVFRWLFVSAVIGVVGSASGQSVPIATGEWAPFTGEKLPSQGIATEIVVAICRAAKIDPVFSFLPWKRAEFQLDVGESFAAFPYITNEQRLAKYDFSEPLFFTTTKFFYYSKAHAFEALKVDKLAEMAKYSVVVLEGTWTISALKAAGIRVAEAPSMASAVQMLRWGRVDFLVMEQTVSFEAIKKAFPDDIDDFKVLENNFFGSAGSRLMVSRTYPQSKALLEKFNEGLRIIKSNGVLDRIAKKNRLIVN